MWWCDDCDPDPILILNGRVHLITSYRDALSHVEHYCEGRKSDYKALIRDFARAKGLLLRVGEKQARSFFSENPSRERTSYNDPYVAYNLQDLKSQNLTF